MLKIPENFILKTFAASASYTTGYTGNWTLNSVASMVAGTSTDKQVAILVDSITSPTQIEIVYYSTINTGTATVNVTNRAQEGTTAQDWTGGGYLYQANTKGIIDTLARLEGNNAMSGNNAFSGTNTFTGQNTFSGTAANSFTTTSQTQFTYGISVNAGRVTLDASELQMNDGSDYLLASNNNIFFYRNSFGGPCGALAPYYLSVGNAAGTTAGHLDAYDGGTAKPAYTTLYDDGGTAHYLFFDTNGRLRKHTSIPTANTDGTVVSGRKYVGTIAATSTGSHAESIGFKPSYVEFYLTGVTGEAGATSLYSKSVIVSPNTTPTAFEAVNTTGGHYVDNSSVNIGYLNYASGDDTVATFTSWDTAGFTWSLDSIQAGTTVSGYYIAHE